MFRLIPFIAAIGLAGCHASEVTLALPPAFFPSAVAHDPVNDRFFVGSYATGEVALLRHDGSRVATLRPPDASAPVAQLVYDTKARRLWTLTTQTLEVIDLAPLPVRRAVVAARDDGNFVDLVVAGDQAFVLDAMRGDVWQVDAAHATTRLVARLPSHDAPSSERAALHSTCDGATRQDSAALMLLPDQSALVAAVGGQLWRIDRANGAIAEVRLSAPLTHVSQMVLVESDAVALHVAVLRGRDNEVLTMHLAPDAQRAVVDTGTRRRFDTPFRGTYDGRKLVVLLGRLRHHASFCGDNRPNLPARLASYFPTAAQGALEVARGANR